MKDLFSLKLKRPTLTAFLSKSKLCRSLRIKEKEQLEQASKPQKIRSNKKKTQINNKLKKMKLVWSPENASKAYIETVKSCEVVQEFGVAELISAMAAGWNAQYIVETWSQGGVTATSIGLAVASRHTKGRHTCIVSDERSKSEYLEAMNEAGMAQTVQVIVGEPEKVLDSLVGVDFLVVDCKRKDFVRFLRLAKLSQSGAVLVCKNASFVIDNEFKWKSVVDGGLRRLVRSVYLPVGKGLDIAYVGCNISGINGESSTKRRDKGRWIKHFDQQSGEEYVIRI